MSNNNKRNILFVVTSFGTGGIIRSLQNFLNSYDTSKCHVDVFVMVHQGAYNGVLKNCDVLPCNKLIEASVSHFENQKGAEKLLSLLLKIFDKVSRYRLQRCLLYIAGRKLVKNQQYDATIGFSEGLPTLMVSMMPHHNKIGWIHCDYANYLAIGAGKNEFNVYENLESIVCVSEYTRKSFMDIYPELAPKTHVIYNIVDDKMMRELAKAPIKEPFDGTCFNIVSVGRIDPVKRLSIVPKLAREVVDSNCKIRWYVIGPKGTNKELKCFLENIKHYEMTNIVIPLGEKANPYPYIANADLLVNTSTSEACPYVINEAKILGTPVVCTNFCSAKEFIEYGINGYYEPIEKMSERIVQMIKKPNELSKIREELSGFKYDNQQILQQIYSLITLV